MSRVRSIRPGLLTAAITAAVLAAVALPAAANANIIAGIELPAGGTRTDLDIALYDATTGNRLPLPAGVNTTDDEYHPSLTPQCDRTVNGQALAPGLYQVTVRALAPNGRIRDLGRPVLIRIRRPHHR